MKRNLERLTDKSEDGAGRNETGVESSLAWLTVYSSNHRVCTASARVRESQPACAHLSTANFAVIACLCSPRYRTLRSVGGLREYLLTPCSSHMRLPTSPSNGSGRFSNPPGRPLGPDAVMSAETSCSYVLYKLDGPRGCPDAQRYVWNGPTNPALSDLVLIILLARRPRRSRRAQRLSFRDRDWLHLAPMAPTTRSLNCSASLAIRIGEARRPAFGTTLLASDLLLAIA